MIALKFVSVDKNSEAQSLHARTSCACRDCCVCLVRRQMAPQIEYTVDEQFLKQIEVP